MRFTLIILIASLFVLGCRSHTVIGGYTDSADKKYRVYARVYGAYGHSFLDKTRKEIRISIVTTNNNASPLFKSEYNVTGADVGWSAVWDQGDNLTVVIYDYGDGVSYYDARKNGSRTNYLATLTYHFNPQAGTFAEASTKAGVQ